MVVKKVGRRRFVSGTAAASTALLAAPFVRGAYAAGQVSVFSGITGYRPATTRSRSRLPPGPTRTRLR